MNSQTRRDIRFGLISLALSGLLMTLAAVVRGPMSGLTGEFLLRDAASPNWGPAWAIGVVGSVLQVYGFLGLYRYLTYRAENRLAFLAAVLSATAMALFIGPASFIAFYSPVVGNLYLQGNEAMIAVWNARLASTLGSALFGVMGVGYIFGPILFAVAIWRDGRLPKWTGIFLALSSALTAYPVFFPAEVLGMVLLLISSSVMAWKGWRESAPEAASSASQEGVLNAVS